MIARGLLYVDPDAHKVHKHHMAWRPKLLFFSKVYLEPETQKFQSVSSHILQVILLTKWSKSVVPQAKVVVFINFILH